MEVPRLEDSGGVVRFPVQVPPCSINPGRSVTGYPVPSVNPGILDRVTHTAPHGTLDALKGDLADALGG